MQRDRGKTGEGWGGGSMWLEGGLSLSPALEAASNTGTQQRWERSSCGVPEGALPADSFLPDSCSPSPQNWGRWIPADLSPPAGGVSEGSTPRLVLRVQKQLETGTNWVQEPPATPGWNTVLGMTLMETVSHTEVLSLPAFQSPSRLLLGQWS